MDMCCQERALWADLLKLSPFPSSSQERDDLDLNDKIKVESEILKRGERTIYLKVSVD